MRRKKRNRNRIGERNKGRKAGEKGRKKLEDKKGGGKRSVKEGNKRREEKKRVIGKNWALPGIEPMPGLSVLPRPFKRSGPLSFHYFKRSDRYPSTKAKIMLRMCKQDSCLKPSAAFSKS